PRRHRNTSVASNSIPLFANTRASSIVSAVPLPSSLAPGAGFSSVAGSNVGGAPPGSAGAAAPARCPPRPPARAGRARLPAAQHHAVVVARDVEPARALAGQQRHHVAQLDVLRDALDLAAGDLVR